MPWATFTMKQLSEVVENFAVSFSLKFLSISMHISGSSEPITLIHWKDLFLMQNLSEYRSCQFWSKVVMSELEQRAILVTVYYGRHTEASKRGYKWAHLTGQNLLVLLVGLPFWVPISLAPPLVNTFFMFLQRLNNKSIILAF